MGIINEIEAEEFYPADPILQEDYMYAALYDLADREPPVISDEQATALFAGWIMQRRPDTAVIKVTPQPRGYGRGYMNE